MRLLLLVHSIFRLRFEWLLLFVRCVVCVVVLVIVYIYCSERHNRQNAKYFRDGNPNLLYFHIFIIKLIAIFLSLNFITFMQRQMRFEPNLKILVLGVSSNYKEVEIWIELKFHLNISQCFGQIFIFFFCCFVLFNSKWNYTIDIN